MWFIVTSLIYFIVSFWFCVQLVRVKSCNPLAALHPSVEQLSIFENITKRKQIYAKCGMTTRQKYNTKAKPINWYNFWPTLCSFRWTLPLKYVYVLSPEDLLMFFYCVLVGGPPYRGDRKMWSKSEV